MIKKVTDKEDCNELSVVLNKSHSTIAKQFNLTKENSPTNPAFINEEQLKAQFTDFREFYKLIIDDKLIGMVALEQSQKDKDIYFIERLSVLPEHRHNGHGKQLMDFAEKRIYELKGRKISIGVINENTLLKEWYSSQGYAEAGLKKFDHLPFTVCFMEKVLYEFL